MKFFRICKEPYRTPAVAFSGVSSSKANHRWSWGRPGTRAVYCSDSLALAALEMLVHLRPLPRIFTPCVHYVVEIPAKMLERPKPSTLPPGWDADVAVAASRDFGSAFLSSRRAVGLIVPTAIIPEGANVVLNVAHEAFDLKWVSGPFAFNFDRRLS